MKKFGRLFGLAMAAAAVIGMFAGCPTVDPVVTTYDKPVINYDKCTNMDADTVVVATKGDTENAPFLRVVVSNLDSSSLRYQWYDDDGEIDDATSRKYTVDVSKTGTSFIHVRVWNTQDSSNGTYVDSDEITVKVQASASETYAASVNVTASPVSATYAAGASVSPLSVTATSTASGNAKVGTLKYQWYKDGAAISGATSSTYTPFNGTAPSSTTATTAVYYCVVTNDCTGSVSGTATSTATSGSATITVNAVAIVNAATPAIASVSGTASYASGASVSAISVSASSTDGGTLSYKWYDSSSSVVSTSASFTPWTSAPAVSSTTSYTYYCVVTNTNTSVNGTQTASATSGTVTITVTPAGSTDTYAASVTIDTNPVSASYKAGATVTGLYVTASASASGLAKQGTISYQWYQNGAAISGATSMVYTPFNGTAPSSSSTSTYLFYCVVTNDASSIVTGSPKTTSATSSVAVITVEAAEVVNAATPVISGVAGTASYNAGASVTTPVSVTASVSDSGTLSYKWYDSNGSVVSTAASFTPWTTAPSVTSATNYTYYCVVTNTNTSVNGTQTASAISASVVITVNPVASPTTPVITSDLETTVSASNSTTLSITATGNGTLTYQLYKDGAASGSASSSGSFTVEESGSYYIVVTNTLNGSSKTATSETCVVTISSYGTGGISIQF